jgi:pimeloyl-ACP methyl ester carboxylesterase
VQGVSTLYYEAGDGPVVLLLHGNATSARDWWRVMDELAKTHRVLAPALPGYGGTGPIGDVRPRRLASFIDAFLTALEVDHAIVVGHSYGGLLAAEFALAYPDRVTRLVLADSAGLGRAVNLVLILIALVPRPVHELAIVVLLLPGGAVLRTFLTGLQLRQPWRVPPYVWLDQARLTRSQNFLRTSFQVLRTGIGPAGQRFRVTGRLGEIQVPALVIWGLTDRLFPLRQALNAVRRLPAGRLAIIPGAGHVSHLDSHEEFIDALSPFIRDEIR